MQFHEKLRTLMTMHALSPEEVAEKMRVSTEIVADWEKGSSSPSLRQMVLLGEIFGLSFEQITDESFIPGVDPEVARRQRTKHRIVLACKWVILFACCLVLLAVAAHFLRR